MRRKDKKIVVVVAFLALILLVILVFPDAAQSYILWMVVPK